MSEPDRAVFDLRDVAVREVLATRVAVLEHRGDPAGIPESARRFHAWRKANGVSPKSASSFMVFRAVEDAGYAMDLCVEFEGGVPDTDGVVKAGLIPGGRCAVLRVDGKSNNQRPAVAFLRNEWLPESGERASGFPAYCQRRLLSENGTDTREIYAEVFLPLE